MRREPLVVAARRAAGLVVALGAAAVLAIVVAACSSAPSGSLSVTPGAGATMSLVPGDEGSPEASLAPTGSGDVASPAPAITSPVSGLVTHVDLAGLGKVTGFRLLTSDGQQIDFKMGVQENAAEFPAAHLSEHVASAEPVLVYFRQVGADLVVYRLEDATPSASPSTPAVPSVSPPADTHSDAPAAS